MKKLKIKLYYYSAGNNFGDAVNPLILNKLFDLEHEMVSVGAAQLFMIGSILQKTVQPATKIFSRITGAIKPPLYIWSSGFIKSDIKGSAVPRKLNVCALRGNLTKQLLKKITGQNYDIPLGDGGLLIPRLLPDMPVKKYAVGIIPHFIEENMPELQAIQSKIPESTIISPLGNPLLTAEKIAECETVISSSLHGLIAADASNIPNRQMVLSNRIKGGYFKYKDYYSVYGKEIAPLTANELLNERITADTIRNAYDIPFNQIQEIQEKLLEAFPFR